MELYGLVLMGGKSKRMGQDKSQMVYHENKPQSDYVYNLLNKYCKKTFLSISNSLKEKEYLYNTIVDVEENKGPITGILSAFNINPNVAWLVCPIDMPFVTEDVITYLLNQRDLEKDCTCFFNQIIQAPDPLLCIYEPTIYSKLLEAKEKEYRCPKKSILSSNNHMVLPQSSQWLFNANTQEQLIEAKNKISKQ